jgi:hypothetical protein
MREKEERRQNYAKYVKEINLPLELDREELRREAKNLRLAAANAAINRSQEDLFKIEDMSVDPSDFERRSNIKNQSLLPPINKHSVVHSSHHSPLLSGVRGMLN